MLNLILSGAKDRGTPGALHPITTHFKRLAPALLLGCSAQRPATHEPPPVVVAAPATPRAPVSTEAPLVVTTSAQKTRPPTCQPADWAEHHLPPLLRAGKGTKSARADTPDTERLRYFPRCQDSPDLASERQVASVDVDGVRVRATGEEPAGQTGRDWSGNRCTFEVALADGSGKAVQLGAAEVPPFTSVIALTRHGSAVYLNVGFNGYTRDFPGGGNRIVALDLCDGKVVWQSANSTSNDGLLLLGDYLISPYGFTNERRYVYVLDAHSGAVVQKLPVLENICPSRSWAPNWHAGERCDAPGQLVGAATNPRVEDGHLLVDTNTGSSAFSFL